MGGIEAIRQRADYKAGRVDLANNLQYVYDSSIKSEIRADNVQKSKSNATEEVHERSFNRLAADAESNVARV